MEGCNNKARVQMLDLKEGKTSNLIFYMIAGDYFDKDLQLEALRKYNEGFDIDIDKVPENKQKSLQFLPKRY